MVPDLSFHLLGCLQRFAAINSPFFPNIIQHLHPIDEQPTRGWLARPHHQNDCCPLWCGSVTIHVVEETMDSVRPRPDYHDATGMTVGAIGGTEKLMVSAWLILGTSNHYTSRGSVIPSRVCGWSVSLSTRGGKNFPENLIGCYSTGTRSEFDLETFWPHPAIK